MCQTQNTHLLIEWNPFFLNQHQLERVGHLAGHRQTGRLVMRAHDRLVVRPAQ
jgi:hypothetical protein